MAHSLDDYLAFGPALDTLYFRLLRRSAFSDQVAFMNWAYHHIENGRDLAWIEQAIKDDPQQEWQKLQGGGGSNGGSATPAGPSQPDPGAEFPTAPSTGGFWETATSTAVRPALPAGLKLPSRGAFALPPPYNLRCFRITNASDGDIRYAGYSYWSMLSLQAGGAHVLAFVGRGDHPIFFVIDLKSGEVRSLGELVSYAATGEQWYWDPMRPSCLYVPNGSQLHRVDVTTGADEVVVDISARHPGCMLWQCHSSRDGQTHSYTVRRASEPWDDLGAGASRLGGLQFFPVRARYDECACDVSGRWLLVKEVVSRGGRDHVDNWIYDLANPGAPRILLDEDGAMGHCDMGDGFAAGEDDSGDTWRLQRLDLQSLQSRLCYHGLGEWGNGLGHVSVVGEQALVSNNQGPYGPRPRANELVRVPLDGTLRCQVLAPNLMSTPETNDYTLQVKGAYDRTGGFVSWTANPEGRLDLFALELPAL